MAERLDIDALRALKAITDHGGVTRAAERLALSQSAVSHKIRRLEERLDCVLLDRRPGAPLLTEAGRRLLGYAERILHLHEEAVQALGARGLSGRIRLGLTEDITSGRLARILARFAQLHPDVRVRAHVSQSLALQRALDARDIDVAVMQILAAQIAETDVVLAREKLHWVRGLDFEIAQGRALPFLAFDEECFYRRWAFERAASLASPLETALECASAAGIKAAVEAGMGVALLSARHLTRAMVVIEAGFPEPPEVAYVVRRSAGAGSAAARALADEIARDAERI